MGNHEKKYLVVRAAINCLYNVYSNQTFLNFLTALVVLIKEGGGSFGWVDPRKKNTTKKKYYNQEKNIGNDLTVKTHVSLVPTVSIWATDLILSYRTRFMLFWERFTLY